jgi:hypothetical protein
MDTMQPKKKRTKPTNRSQNPITLKQIAKTGRRWSKIQYGALGSGRMKKKHIGNTFRAYLNIIFPPDVRQSKIQSDANFHLLSNYDSLFENPKKYVHR